MESAPPPFDPLGAEIRRWLAEARRLTDPERPAAGPGAVGPGLPRADDFGHVTTEAKVEADVASAPRAFDLRRTPRILSDASVVRPTERHGIFVASGWGTRARAS